MRWMHNAITESCTAEQAKKLSLPVGNKSVDVGELFEINGTFSNDNIYLNNTSAQLDYIGYALPEGIQLSVTGDCGQYVGAHLAGGKINVDGNAQHFVGCAMRKGTIEIEGDCGNYVGGAFTGQKKGMSGGTILVHGNTGDFTGDLMRRGIIKVTGNMGDHCGSRMIAGTITNLGTIGKQAGIGMRRGTLLLPELPKDMTPTFYNCGRHNLGYLTLLLDHLRTQDSAFQTLHPMRRRVQKYMGDTSVGGLGEILIWIK